MERSEPAQLDEVIRREHELEREAARLIREGRDVRRSASNEAENRIVIAQSAEGCREAMVSD